MNETTYELPSIEEMLIPNEKTIVIIDGSNTYASSKALGVNIDFKRMREYFYTKTRLVRMAYYTALLGNGEGQRVQSLTNWLSHHGYVVISKEAKEYGSSTENYTIKGNMDIEIAVDLLGIAEFVEHIVLMSGDGDFRYPVEVAQKKGVKVSAISTKKSDPSVMSYDLTKQVDSFTDLADMVEFLIPMNRGKHGES